MEKIKDTLVGDYNWRVLCIPQLPWSRKRAAPPFFGKDEKISVLVALVMGLQHALSMVGGIITPPVILAGTAYGDFTAKETEYLVSAALIVSSIASFIQVTQFKIPFTRYVIGSGLLSVMGVTFAYLPVAQAVIQTLRSCTCAGVPCTTGAGGTCDACPVALVGSCFEGRKAYGHVLGTILVTCWFQVALSFCPPRYLEKIFPPVVTGPTVILIGVALITTGIEEWGGGTYCASQVLTTKVLCSGNGDVQLPFGHKFYLGLGLVVFFTLLVVELFGSPFMRNTQIVIGLVVGVAVAAAVQVTRHDANGVPHHYRYVTNTEISQAPWITFLWVHTFPLGFYAPAVLPMLFACMVSVMEAIGDVTATTEASQLQPFGADFDRAVQGAVLADGLNSFWAALATMTPVVTYAQNNGVISLSGCASRRAGYACCFWLMLLGVIGKFGGIILTIPTCVLGAMTTFLFASVIVSGIGVLTSRRALSRRDRFITIMALGIGLGVNLVPAWINISGQQEYPYQGNFWPINPSWSSGFLGLRDALIIMLSNGFSIGGLIALFLNLILPKDKEPVKEADGLPHSQRMTESFRKEKGVQPVASDVE
ncbi:unnamed protein product [Calypogeia fissa]